MVRSARIPSHRVRVIRDSRHSSSSSQTVAKRKERKPKRRRDDADDAPTSTTGLQRREVKIYTLAFVVGEEPENPAQWWRENDRSRWLDEG